MAPANLETKTHCPYCSLQCGIVLDASTTPAALRPQADFPTNMGGLCAKGWTAAELLDHPQRRTQPLVRDARAAPLRPTDWDDALDRIVDAITTAQRRYGRDSVGCFGGGDLTNEKAYQLGKFARVALGTSAIDYNGRFCMSSAANAATRAFGIDLGSSGSPASPSGIWSRRCVCSRVPSGRWCSPRVAPNSIVRGPIRCSRSSISHWRWDFLDARTAATAR